MKLLCSTRFAGLAAAALAVVVLVAAGCSSGGGGEAGEVTRITAAPSTTAGRPVAVTTVVTLPGQVSEEVAVAPAGVFVSVADDSGGVEDGAGDDGGGVLVYAGPDLDGLSEGETGSEAVPAEVVLRPVEFRTTGAGGITFYVRLGASHPLTECLSYVDGNPALSRLSAATAEAAKVEIATIGQNCLGNPQAISENADPDAAAVGCVDDTSDRIVDCPTPGTPQPATQPASPPADAAPGTAAAEGDRGFPLELWGCPPGQDCQSLIAAPPQRRQPTPGLSLDIAEIRNRPGLLYGLYPNPYLEGEVGTDENQANIRTAQYGTLNQIMDGNYEASVREESRVAVGWGRYAWQVNVTPEDLENLKASEPEIAGFLAGDIRPEHTSIGWQILTDFVSDYETAMAYNGYTIYNTCQNPTGTRFPQLNPNSSMLDFMRQDDGWLIQASGLPPQDLPLEWYFQQAVQSKYDRRTLVWHNSWHREPQILLCYPLLDARDRVLQPGAHNIWMPSSYDPLRYEMTAPQNWDHHAVAISDDRSVVVLASCYVGADRELIYGDVKDFLTQMVFEDGHYKWGDGIGPDEGFYQTCEEAASLVDASSGTPSLLTDFLEDASISFTEGATYEGFVYGDYQYPGDSLTSHFG